VTSETPAISNHGFETVFGSLQFLSQNTQQCCRLMDVHLVCLKAH